MPYLSAHKLFLPSVWVGHSNRSYDFFKQGWLRKKLAFFVLGEHDIYYLTIYNLRF